MSRNASIGSLYDSALMNGVLGVRSFAADANPTSSLSRFATFGVANPVAAGLRWVVAEPTFDLAAPLVRPRLVTEAEADTIANGGNWDATLVKGYVVSGDGDQTTLQKSVMATFEAVTTYDPANPDAGFTTAKLYGLAADRHDAGVYWIPPGRVLLLTHTTINVGFNVSVFAAEVDS